MRTFTSTASDSGEQHPPETPPAALIDDNEDDDADGRYDDPEVVPPKYATRVANVETKGCNKQRDAAEYAVEDFSTLANAYTKYDMNYSVAAGL